MDAPETPCATQNQTPNMEILFLACDCLQDSLRNCFAVVLLFSFSSSRENQGLTYADQAICLRYTSSNI